MSLVGLASPSPSTSLSSSVKASSSWSNSLRENSNSSAAIGEKATKRTTATTSTTLNGIITTTKRKQATINNMVEPVEPKLESERTTTEQKSGVSILAANSFFNEFVDCMQNLPNRLQVLLTDLSTIDALVKSNVNINELFRSFKMS